MRFADSRSLQRYAEEQSLAPDNCYQIADYLVAGLPHEEALAWFDAVIPPDDALGFREMGMGPREAWQWGFRPDLVKEFRAAGFRPEDAWDWVCTDLPALEAAVWRMGGFLPGDVEKITAVTQDKAVAILWALSGLDPRDAYEHARNGASPVHFQRTSI